MTNTTGSTEESVQTPHAAMARQGAVLLLLLLLTSAAAVRYRWLAPVSLPGSVVQIISAGSTLVCAFQCEGLTPEECSGFTFEPDDGTCSLFSGTASGLTGNSSQPITDRYMARTVSQNGENRLPIHQMYLCLYLHSTSIRAISAF